MPITAVDPKRGVWPALDPDRISVVLGHEGTAVMAAFGLTWLPADLLTD
ncbi:MAG: hypothetical protein HZT43_08455 [Exiguobacterium profundum]|nr:MAG: hypothetical protein HZT43_08455 [Exiguobacterium profundum]